MPFYYVNNNQQFSGDHEVHAAGCDYFPSDSTPLGQHAECATAVAQANLTHSPANGCYWCSRPCHRS